MRTITTVKEAYQFNELSDEAKEKARDWYKEGALDYEWYDGVYEDATTIGELMGITIDKIYFSGFYSQGDGAMFEGSYRYEKNGVQKVKDYAPKDKELHRIAQTLQDIQKKHFYKLSANVSHRGHYYHENCTEFNVYKDGNYLYSQSEQDAEEEIIEALKDLMRWIYKTLESEYDYLLSDESVDETIMSNEYDFDIDGNRC